MVIVSLRSSSEAAPKRAAVISRENAAITIKKTAGCSKRGLGKDAMIEAFSMEPEGTHRIINILRQDPQLLKKKTNYVQCMDDIADSYWCLKTCQRDLNGNI